jgi:hypothetical protein
VKKQTAKKKTKVTGARAVASPRLDWTAVRGAMHEAFEWALDVAVGLARGFPEEIDSVERVREFMRARMAGGEARVSADDLLLAFSLVVSAIERDLAIDDSGATFVPLHLPTAKELGVPWMPRLFENLWIRIAPARARA